LTNDLFYLVIQIQDDNNALLGSVVAYWTLEQMVMQSRHSPLSLLMSYIATAYYRRESVWKLHEITEVVAQFEGTPFLTERM
jgi:hypothetical protein